MESFGQTIHRRFDFAHWINRPVEQLKLKSRKCGLWPGADRIEVVISEAPRLVKG